MDKTTNNPLFMLKLALDAARLVVNGQKKQLPLRNIDLGYLVHCQLSSLFGKNSPAPFSIKNERSRTIEVLAYTSRSQEQLVSYAEQFADPAFYSAVDWKQFSQKPMPKTWTPGLTLGFHLTSCPVVRMASDGPKHKKGAEVDIFLSRCWSTGDPSIPVDRNNVYQEWLHSQFERRGGARLLETKVFSYQREYLLRRSQGTERKAKRLEKPIASFQGTIEVTDSQGFSSLLQRGIGRHRAFGLGMLLLKPVRNIHE